MNYTNWVYDVEKESQKIQKLTERNSEILSQVHNLPIKKAAVLIALFQYAGKPHVILSERSHHLRIHAGEVALPGGKVDDDDENYIAAALRETEEEIGLLREHVEIVGAITPVPSSIAKVIITPVVGFIKNIENVKLDINENEVNSVFAVPLEYFTTQGDVQHFMVRGKQQSMPRYYWDCKNYSTQLPDTSNEALKMLFNGDKVYKIWGITGVMLHIYASFIFKKLENFSNYHSIAPFFRDMVSKILRENKSKL